MQKPIFDGFPKNTSREAITPMTSPPAIICVISFDLFTSPSSSALSDAFFLYIFYNADPGQNLNLAIIIVRFPILFKLQLFIFPSLLFDFPINHAMILLSEVWYAAPGFWHCNSDLICTPIIWSAKIFSACTYKTDTTGGSHAKNLS